MKKVITVCLLVLLVVGMCLPLCGCEKMTEEEQRVYDAGKAVEEVLDDYEEFVKKTYKNPPSDYDGWNEVGTADKSYGKQYAENVSYFSSTWSYDSPEELKSYAVQFATDATHRYNNIRASMEYQQLYAQMKEFMKEYRAAQSN